MDKMAERKVANQVPSSLWVCRIDRGVSEKNKEER
jgi:hypothetical protein